MDILRRPGRAFWFRLRNFRTQHRLKSGDRSDITRSGFNSFVLRTVGKDPATATWVFSGSLISTVLRKAQHNFCVVEWNTNYILVVLQHGCQLCKTIIDIIALLNRGYYFIINLYSVGELDDARSKFRIVAYSAIMLVTIGLSHYYIRVGKKTRQEKEAELLKTLEDSGRTGSKW